MSARAAYNQGYDYRGRVGGTDGGVSLNRWLATHYRHTDAPTWRSRIESGWVRIDGVVGDPSTPVRAGQTVVWSRPAWLEPAAPTTFANLYRDADLLAVVKPAGLPTLPAAGFLEHTLLRCVRRMEPGATPLHRLGRYTSGIVLFARNRSTHARVSRDWRDGLVEKRYRTFAIGRPSADRFEIDAPIGVVPHPRLGTVHAASADGKPARTLVRVVARSREGFLADVDIPTGRPHQIRIHLAAAGHPLVGDPLYRAGGHPIADALPGDPGYRLHATRLRLRHPSTGNVLTLIHPPPVDLDVSRLRS